MYLNSSDLTYTKQSSITIDVTVIIFFYQQQLKNVIFKNVLVLRSIDIEYCTTWNIEFYA